jgi:hypothetical protein
MDAVIYYNGIEWRLLFIITEQDIGFYLFIYYNGVVSPIFIYYNGTRWKPILIYYCAVSTVFSSGPPSGYALWDAVLLACAPWLPLLPTLHIVLVPRATAVRDSFYVWYGKSWRLYCFGSCCLVVVLNLVLIDAPVAGFGRGQRPTG